MESINIRNFRAIKDTGGPIEIKPLMIITGEQASGKSTFAKLIYFFKTLPQDIHYFLIGYSFKKETSLERVLNECLVNYFSQLFSFDVNEPEFRITYRYSNEFSLQLLWNAKYFQIDVPKGLYDIISKIYVQQFSTFEKLKNDNELLFTDSIFSNDALEQLENYFKPAYREVNNNYFPASRDFTIALDDVLFEIYSKLDNRIQGGKYIIDNQLLLFRYLKYSNLIKRYFKKSGTFESSIKSRKTGKKLIHLIHLVEKTIRGKYLLQNDEEYIISKTSKILLSNSSSGQQVAIRLLQDIFVSIETGLKLFRVYEEPETHLYPTGQDNISRAIAMLINAHENNNVIITTHSPYILLAFDNLIKAHEIAHLESDAKDRIEKELGISAFSWLDFDKVGAWFLRDGNFINILNDERKGINADYVDEVAKELELTYDQLLSQLAKHE